MKKEGKNIAKAHAAVEKRPYTLQDAVPLLQKVKFAKFDETVEITLRLGVDPKHADQMVRGAVVMPKAWANPKSFWSSPAATGSEEPPRPTPIS